MPFWVWGWDVTNRKGWSTGDRIDFRHDHVPGLSLERGCLPEGEEKVVDQSTACLFCSAGQGLWLGRDVCEGVTCSSAMQWLKLQGCVFWRKSRDWGSKTQRWKPACASNLDLWLGRGVLPEGAEIVYVGMCLCLHVLLGWRDCNFKGVFSGEKLESGDVSWGRSAWSRR